MCKKQGKQWDCLQTKNLLSSWPGRVQSTSVLLRESLKEKNILHIYVPAGCIGKLQPLHLSFNQPLKATMKELFTQWYADQISDKLAKGVQLDAIKIDQHILILKPIHALWIVTSFNQRKRKKKLKN